MVELGAVLHDGYRGVLSEYGLGRLLNDRGNDGVEDVVRHSCAEILVHLVDLVSVIAPGDGKPVTLDDLLII